MEPTRALHWSQLELSVSSSYLNQRAIQSSGANQSSKNVEKGANQSKFAFSILNISNWGNLGQLKICILISIYAKIYQIFLLCDYQVVFRSYRLSKITSKVTMLTPQKGANQYQNQQSQLERLFEHFWPFPNIVHRLELTKLHQRRLYCQFNCKLLHDIDGR